MDTEAQLASLAIFIIACSIVYFGTLSSLTNVKEALKSTATGESVSSKDAYMFPVYGSAVLFGLYAVFKYVNKEYLDVLIAIYFGVAGTLSLINFFNSFLKDRVRSFGSDFEFSYKRGGKTIGELNITILQLVLAAPSILIVGYYLYTKNWVASNVLALSFTLSALNLIKIDSFKSGFIMLGGLFIYDIFWVFGTNVMVSVATKFDAPIKILWPKNILELIQTLGEAKPKCTLLGLGDIVVPGAFVCMCLEFDRHKHSIKNKIELVDVKNFKKQYFNVCFVSYCLGLAITMFVMHYFKAAQPALLYLSPMCILSVALFAVINNEFSMLMEYESIQTKVERQLKGKDQVVSSSSEDSDEELNNTSISTVKSQPKSRKRNNKK